VWTNPPRQRRKFILGVALALASVGTAAAEAPSFDSSELDRIQRAAFDYMWEHRDPKSALVYNTTESNAPASPTACGVALSAIPIGIERGWITRKDGYRRAQQLLKSLGKAPRHQGFFYHFLEPRSGKRTWHSELSNIDSAILFAGAMVIAEYFENTTVAQAANRLIEGANWPWFLDGEEVMQWGWTPERGFEGGPMHFSEAILSYLIGLGSPSHPLPKDAWAAMRRPVATTADGSAKMVYTPDGSLFAYLLPLAWFDLRHQHDAYLDYWTNATTAIHSNIQFCRLNQASYRTYAEGLWGLSAAIGPDGYKAYGAAPAVRTAHDGTVAPYVVTASLPLVPDLAIATHRRMKELAPDLWTKYGLGDALNLDRRFVCRDTIALDQGLVLLMIENMRTGLIWRLVMRHPIAERAMAQAGFMPGARSEPLTPSSIPGNPGASMTIPLLDHAVSVDGALSEWIRDEAMDITPSGRRHVESGAVRDAKDASVLAYTGWDREAVYVAGIITDDELVTDAAGADIYQDDCLELYWDLDRNGFRFDKNANDVQLGLSPGGPDGALQLWAWGALNRLPDEVQGAVRRDGPYTFFELRVPIGLLPGFVDRPAKFSLSYHDRDTGEKPAKLHWSIDTASDPGTILFGDVALQRRAP